MRAQCEFDLSQVLDIPHTVIDTRYQNGKDLLRKYPGHYVTVRDEASAVYHVSKPGPNCLPNATKVKEGILYKDNFDHTRGVKYREAMIYDFLNSKLYVYDHNGDKRVITLGAA